jgi:YegS/Rv2252/BmrU family lipid kinase
VQQFSFPKGKSENRKEPAEVVLVVNPNSASGKTGKNWDTLFSEIRKILGSEVDFAFTAKPGDGTTITRNLIRQGVKRIIPIGGDGTINEVANGFFEEQVGIRNSSDKLKPINPDAAMGVVPSGTRNVLARSLGLNSDLLECFGCFVHGKPTKIDVVAVSATNPSSGELNPARIFLNAAEMGIAGELVDRSKKVRGTLNSRLISTITAAVATVPSYESNLCDIDLDNGRERLLAKMTLGIVANGKYLGGGFKAAPLADVYDGLFDLVVLKDSGSFKILDELVKMKSGDYRNEGDIIYLQGKDALVRSKERDVTVTIDGEPAGILPAEFSVHEGSLSVVL